MTDFIRDVRYDGLPHPVRHQLTRVLADHLGAAIAGLRTPTASIIADFTRAVLPGSEATVMGRGRICNAAGAALANACTANALDIDDGFRPAKGHPGAVIIPAALAQAEATAASGKDFLTAVLVGYEVGMRSSVAWHSSRPTYSGSGSWGSLAAAAACARLLGLDSESILHALGIAEYHAPYAEILVSCEHPCMVKDGIHWGAFTGLTAAQLAGRGFTGIPSFLLRPEHGMLIASLGQEWWIQRLYFKFFPCCRWAQPAVAAVLQLRQEQGLRADDVATIRVEAFDAATHLVTRRPCNTEEAQYSLPFPVACALVRGRVTVDEVAGSGLTDLAILELAERVEMIVAPDLEARFPGEAQERVVITTRDGRSLVAGPLSAPGDANAPPSDDELWAKFFSLTEPIIGTKRANDLHQAIVGCDSLDNIGNLTALLA